MNESEDVCSVCGDLCLESLVEQAVEGRDFETLDSLYGDEGQVDKEKAATLLADSAGIEEALGVCSGCARLWVEHPSIEDMGGCSCQEEAGNNLGEKLLSKLEQDRIDRGLTTPAQANPVPMGESYVDQAAGSLEVDLLQVGVAEKRREIFSYLEQLGDSEFPFMDEHCIHCGRRPSAEIWGVVDRVAESLVTG